jgi:hypothetical protein
VTSKGESVNGGRPPHPRRRGPVCGHTLYRIDAYILDRCLFHRQFSYTDTSIGLTESFSVARTPAWGPTPDGGNYVASVRKGVRIIFG